MRVKYPEFKLQDGTRIQIIVGIYSNYGHIGVQWSIEDVNYCNKGKRKFISFIKEIEDDYAFRALTFDERTKIRYQRIVDFVGVDNIKSAFDYAYQLIKPDIAEITKLEITQNNA